MTTSSDTSFVPSNHLKILQLSPSISEPTSYIQATVALVWPYSSSTATLALLLVDTYTHPGQVRGQVKVIFRDGCARQLAGTKVGIGDSVRLKLDGCDWKETEDVISTPGKKLSWDLEYRARVLAEISKDGQQPIIVDYTRSDSEESVLNSRLNRTNGVIATPKSYGNGYDKPSTISVPYLTPVKSTRRSSGGTFIDGLDPLAGADGYITGRGRKRTKFARHSGAWSLIDSDDELQIQEIQKEISNVNTSLISGAEQNGDGEQLARPVHAEAGQYEDPELSTVPVEVEVGKDGETEPLLGSIDAGVGQNSTAEPVPGSGDADIRDIAEAVSAEVVTPNDHTSSLHTLDDSSDLSHQDELVLEVAPVQDVSKPRSINSPVFGQVEIASDTVSKNVLTPPNQEKTLQPGQDLLENNRDISSEDADLSIDQSPPIMGPPQTPARKLQLAPVEMPEIISPSEDSEQANTPRLMPLASPGLPLVSPLIRRSGVDIGYFPTFDDTVSQLDASGKEEQHVAEDSSKLQDSIVEVEENTTHNETISRIQPDSSSAVSEATHPPLTSTNLDSAEGQPYFIPDHWLSSVEANIAEELLQNAQASPAPAEQQLHADTDNETDDLYGPPVSIQDKSQAEDRKLETSPARQTNIFDDEAHSEVSETSGIPHELISTLPHPIAIDAVEQFLQFSPVLEEPEEDLSASHPEQPEEDSDAPSTQVISDDDSDTTSVASDELVSSAEDSSIDSADSAEDISDDEAEVVPVATSRETIMVDVDQSLEAERYSTLIDSEQITNDLVTIPEASNEEDAQAIPTARLGGSEIVDTMSVTDMGEVELPRKDPNSPAESSKDQTDSFPAKTDLESSEDIILRTESSVEITKPQIDTSYLPTPDQTQVDEQIPSTLTVTDPSLSQQMNLIPTPKQTQEEQVDISDPSQTEDNFDQVASTVPILETNAMDSPIHPSKRIIKPKNIPNPYFTPRRSARLSSPGPRKEGLPLSSPLGTSFPSSTHPETIVEGTDHDQLVSPVMPSTEHILSNGDGITTPIAYYARLLSIREHFGQIVDTISICSESSKIERAKTGPKDYHLTLHVIDPSIDQPVLAQIFRPNKNALPSVKVGDAVILRNFKVHTVKGAFALLSTDTSAWAVSQSPESNFISSGPPLEHGPVEASHVATLINWWKDNASKDVPMEEQKENSTEPETRLTRQAKNSPQLTLKPRPTPINVSRRKANMTDNFENEEDEEVIESGRESRSPILERGNRRGSTASTTATKDFAPRRSGRHKKSPSVVHELRDGTRYVDDDKTNHGKRRDSVVHELRDGMKYVDE